MSRFTSTGIFPWFFLTRFKAYLEAAKTSQATILIFTPGHFFVDEQGAGTPQVIRPLTPGEYLTESTDMLEREVLSE